ncbi:MAG: Ig-like domain-containing protein [Bacteroidetes bacterium]|nr:Ig-like domain-containing protein [Bacteroidota bacterium]
MPHSSRTAAPVRLRTYLLPALLSFAAGCAVPVAPTGGPADKEPPKVVKITPSRNQINVPIETRDIRFEFSEYMNESSFNQAFSISPEPVGQPDIRWQRKSVTVRLPENLATNTTYVLTLDNRLKDNNGVAVSGAEHFAFSTGSTVSRAGLSGRVRDALTGSAVKGVDVFAYPTADSVGEGSALPARPKYRTQTNESGLFSFEFMTPGPYILIAVLDKNNNRWPDQSERAGTGHRLVAVASDSSSADSELYLSLFDTESPEVRRVRSISNARTLARLSEEVIDPARQPWAIMDSVTNVSRPDLRVFESDVDSRDIIILSQALPATRHLLIVPALADSSGNVSEPDTLSFSPSFDADTTQTRFVGFFPSENVPADSVTRLLPGESFGVSLSQSFDLERNAGLHILDSEGRRVAYLTDTNDGRNIALRVDSLTRSERMTVAVDGSAFGEGDTTLTRTFVPYSESELGSLSGVAIAEGGAAVRVEAWRAGTGGPIGTVTADSSGHFEIAHLPPGKFRLRIVADANRNGRWDAGSFDPLAPAEALLFTADTLSVRARWESVLPDTLRIPPVADTQGGEE